LRTSNHLLETWKGEIQKY